MTDLDDLTQRYGGRRSVGVRVVALLLVAGLVAGAATYLVWVLTDRFDVEAQGDVATYDVRSDHLTVATLEVVRESTSTEASCTVSALSSDGGVVGEVTVPVTDGPVRQTVEVEIRTERRATTVTTEGCTSPGQPRART
ncbi:DUF4307 domain-containing protein [Nocardioides caldifontis]|uniref:DUF4307 domain-containing protein n=1 Tax=Nocardioides caldifontis TaxID=2588938 RepID=UPI0011E057D2|nr:DUF4307 domain-containing protein [Nocardioides caldifontis]